MQLSVNSPNLMKINNLKREDSDLFYSAKDKKCVNKVESNLKTLKDKTGYFSKYCLCLIVSNSRKN